MKSKIIKFVPAAVFLLFTFAGCILFFALPKKDYSSLEKRYLAEAPEFSVKSFLSGDFIKEIDGDSKAGKVGYVADHFPMRSFFVGLNSYYNLSFGNTADSDYYFGKDGYIITKPYSTDRLDTNIKVISAFGENVDTVLAVVPSAGYILEDKLPLNHTSYSDEMVFKQIEKTKGENLKTVSFTEDLLSLKSKGTSPYYKTDHHWTTPAAFAAYQKLSEALGYVPASDTEFTLEYYPDFYGTTYSASGYFLRDADTLEIMRSETDENICVEITEGDKTEKYSSMYFESHLREDDMYPVFLDGNHSLVRIKNLGANGGRLLVIKDSYAHALVPFLAENYSEIVMVDLRYYKGNISELCAAEDISQALVLYSISNFCTDTNLAFLE